MIKEMQENTIVPKPVSKYDIYHRENKRIREEWFKNHIAYIEKFDNGNLIKIKWREPGTWNMAIVYYIDCKMGYLSVCGDLGEAIYQWHPPIGIDFLGGCDLGYFNGKCQASSCGERGKTWNEEAAQSYLQEYFNQASLVDEEIYDNIWLGGYIENLLEKEDQELFKLWEEERDFQELTKEQKERVKKIADKYMETVNTEQLPKYDSQRVYLEKKRKFEELREEALGACNNPWEWSRFLEDHGPELFGDDYYEYHDIGNTISLRVQAHNIGLKMIREGLNAGKFIIAEEVELPKNSFLARIRNFFGFY